MARITEIKTVCIHSGKYCRPVALKWLNSLGGWDIWVFEHNQDVGLSVSSPNYYRPTFTSLLDIEGTREVLSKRGRPQMTLFAENIIVENVEGFKDLLMSPKVYRVYPDGKQYVVNVVSGSFNLYKTRNNQFNISVRIEEGEIYSQVQ